MDRINTRSRYTIVLAGALSAALVLLLSLACNDGGTGPEQQRTRLDRDLIVLDSLPDLSLQHTDGIDFEYSFTSSQPTVRVNDIIAGTDGGGFLRKVLSTRIVDNVLYISTVKASLTDAVISGAWETSFPILIDNTDRSSSRTNGTITLAKGVGLAGSKLDLSNLELFSGTAGGTEVVARIVSGSVDLSPVLSAQFWIQNRDIQQLSMELSDDIGFKLDLELSTEGAVSLTKQIPLLSRDFIVVQDLERLPVVAQVSFALDIGLTATTSNAGTTRWKTDADFTGNLGGKYASGEWSTIWTPNVTLRQSTNAGGPSGSSVVFCSLIPTLQVSFYSMSQSRFQIVPLNSRRSDSLSSVNWYWQLEGGLASSLLMNVDAFDPSLPRYSDGFAATTVVFDADSGETACPSPGIPVNPFPDHGSVSTTGPTELSWLAVSNATSYDVLLDAGAVCSGTIQTVCELEEELAPGTHTWQVLALNDCDTTPGPVWEFTVCMPPGIPGTPQPANGASLDQSPSQLNWADAFEAESYDVYIDGELVCDDATLSSCTLGQALASGLHSWRVVAHNDCGDTEGPTWSFAIDCPLPSMPSNPSPEIGDTLELTPIVLDWPDVPAATSYDVVLNGNIVCSDVLVSACTQVGSVTTGHNTWQVIARNDCGDVTGDEWEFTVCPPTQPASSPIPANGAALTTGPDELAWSASANALRYDVRIDGDLVCNDIIGTSCGLTTPLAAGNHQWQVIAFSDCDSIVGPQWTFDLCIAPNVPTDPIPAVGTDLSESPTILSWSGSAPETTFDVYLDDELICNDIAEDECEIIGAIEAGAHTWQVIATTDCGEARGPLWSFSVNCPLAEPPSAPMPADLDTVADAPVVLDWSDSESAISYDVYIDGTVECSDDSLSECEITRALIPGEHTWQVIATNDCGQVIGDSWAFTICADLAVPQLPVPKDGALLESLPSVVEWQAVIGARSYDVFFDGSPLCVETTDTSCTVPQSLSQGSHTWQVIARGDCESSNGPLWTFSTCESVEPASAPIPGDDAKLTVAPATLDWADVHNVASYDVLLDGELICSGDTISSCDIDGLLTFGDHTWQVISINACDSTPGPVWDLTLCPNLAVASQPDPANGADFDDPPTELDWADVDGATSYDVLLDGIITCEGLSSSQCTISGTLEVGQHIWQVIAHNQCTSSDGPIWAFSVGCPLPSQPQNPTPATGMSLLTSPTVLDWDNSVRATGYDVYVDSQLVCSNATASECAITALTPGLHHWQVTAKNDCGDVIGDLWQFEVCPLPSLPHGPSPANGDSVTVSPAVLDWDDTDGATGYDVYLNSTLICANVNVSACSVSGSLQSGEHRWRVVAHNSCGTTDGPEWTFTACVVPSPPNFPSVPDGGTVGASPMLLDWADTPELDTFDVFVDGILECDNAVTSECVLSPPLIDGEHTWQVVSFNDCGNTVGPVWTFTICPPPSEPEGPTPINLDTLPVAPVILDWDDAPGADSYDVIVDGVRECTATTSSQCTLSTLLTDGFHGWQVIARNDCDSTVSPLWTFRICPSVGLPSTPDPIDGDSLTDQPTMLDWNDLANATSYDVWLNGSLVCEAVAQSVCSVGTPLPNGVHLWQVIARGECDSSAGPTWQFTLCVPPAPPDNPVPVDDDTLASSPILLDWSDADGATDYDVLVDGSLECSAVPVSACTLGSPLSSGEHTWQVITHNGCDSTIGPTWTMTICTAIDPASNPAPAHDDTLMLSPPLLSWDSVAGAIGYDVLIDGLPTCTGVTVNACTLDVPLSGGDHNWQVHAFSDCDTSAGPVWNLTICPQPGAPANPTPMDHDTSSSVPSVLNWDDVLNAVSYDVLLDSVLVCSGNTESACTLATVLSEGTYNWQVIARSDCDSTIGVEWQFTVCAPPESPQGALPQVNDTLFASPALLDWDDAVGAASYDVYVDSALICTAIVASECSLSASLNIGDHSWQVIAINDCDSVAGAEWTFTICTAPGSPANPSPLDTDTLTTSTVILDWDDASDAASYDVLVDSVLTCEGVTVSTCTLSSPLSAGDYLWQVIARNDCDSLPGPEWSFTICVPPDTSRTPLPTDGDTLTVKPVLLDWDDASGATSYDVYLDLALECAGATESACTLSSNLDVGAHTWQVISINDCDSTAGPVWGFDFCPVLDTATVISPTEEDTIPASPVVLDFTDVTGADRYDVLVDGNPSCTDLSESACTLGVTLDDGSHTWQVIASHDCDSVVGPEWTFTICPVVGVPSDPQPIDNDTLEIAPAFLDWGDTPGAAWYDVLVDSVTVCDSAVVSQCISGGSLTVGSHTWQVIAHSVCDSVVGPEWHITISGTAPD